MSPDRPPAFSRPGSPRGRGPSICSPHSASLHPHFSPSCLVPSGVPSGTHPGRQGANKSTGTPTHPGAEVAPGCPVSVSPSPASVSSAVNQDAPSTCLPGSRRWWLGQVLAPGGCRGQGCFWVHTLAPPAHSGLGRGGGVLLFLELTGNQQMPAGMDMELSSALGAVWPWASLTPSLGWGRRSEVSGSPS